MTAQTGGELVTQDAVGFAPAGLVAVAGVDVGTECVKAVILDTEGVVIGRGVNPMRGDFSAAARRTLRSALFDAQLEQSALAAVCGTGFGGNLVPDGTMTAVETICHAVGAYYHFPHAMSVIDLGGRQPRLIHVDQDGRPGESYNVRRCATGIGTFLYRAARYLDVHPTQLQELAAAADSPARIGSFCSTLSLADVQERLREGASREEIALGCMRSIAERIVEIEGFREPLKVSGGVPEYYPGVLWALAEITSLEVSALPEPIMTGALGAALRALVSLRERL